MFFTPIGEIDSSRTLGKSAVEQSDDSGPHFYSLVETPACVSRSDGSEIVDVFGREQSKARNSGMCCRRIVREENHSKIFSSA
jgi:hypothetical protein